MISFELTDEQTLVRDTARGFAERVLPPKAAARDRSSEFPVAELRALAELGLMGVNIPAALGGAEAGVVAYSLAMTEIARACASTAVTMAVTNMVAEVIARFGTEAQRERYVPRLTSGEYVAGAFALREPEAGSDPGSMRTTAERTADGWRASRPEAVDHAAARAGVFVVWARTGDAGHQGHLRLPGRGRDARPQAPASTRTSSACARSKTVPLTFDDCEVPRGRAARRAEASGLSVAMMALDGGRIGIASQALGIATAALEEADDLRARAQAVRPGRSPTSRPSSGCSPTPRPSSTPRAS